MITVKPIEDNIRKEQLLSRYHCSAADSTILVMKDLSLIHIFVFVGQHQFFHYLYKNVQ